MMTLEEEGAYRRALDYCWINGSLPSDPQKLARVIGKSCSIEVANTVQQMFTVDKKNPEKIYHERLEVERKKQREHRHKKSKAGTASGLSRRNKKKLSAEQVLDECSDSVQTEGEQKRTLHTASASASANGNSEAKASGDESPPNASPSQPDTIWKMGLGMLTSAGITEKDARSFLGGMVKRYGRNELITAIGVTSAEKPADPQSYLVKVLENGHKANGASSVWFPK